MTLAADPAPRTWPVRESAYRPRGPLDLPATLGILGRGPRDPTFVQDGPVLWLTLRTVVGIATLALRTGSGEVRASAWGPGADAALALVPALCGALDDPDGFDPSSHPLLAATAQRRPGIRLTRTGAVFDALAGVVLEQKVTGLQAYGAWRSLVTRFGDPAPGPTPRPMAVAPDAAGWRRIPSWAWHRAGVEPPQSRAVVHAAGRAAGIERAVHAAPDGPARDRALTSLPGIGLWTSAETRIRALGDPDAVSVGDYHLPHEVGFALTGHRTDDAGMLELLAPWAGHRQRVVRLIRMSGALEPRRGPRLAPEDHRKR
ncbi:MAG: DNA-3-methyladenine glycosylase 2 family protein [Microbacterium sp.]|jgi:3-methyladenine DNA glycosylase/8-oxoguanine DNA glycosylase|uniref:DNA-3-methyladenine glycosylase family protein n=1 Tax=Microbacterium sp. TaxID=51671 RepID=UPI00282FD479|nr:DNA-3-methyladenine glycosylase 2 family protein [Microbacterium sp.]MDR2321790.1 DNA-3-methyladenine glycosylase 2 family protein [Microbacterium sp.]